MVIGQVGLQLSAPGEPTLRKAVEEQDGPARSVPGFDDVELYASTAGDRVVFHELSRTRVYSAGPLWKSRKKPKGVQVRKITICVIATMFAAASLCLAAEDVTLGTWKMNEAKSKIAPGAPKNIDVVYAAAGDSVKITVDGLDGDGKPAHNEWTGKFDGKDYPLVGDPAADTRSYKRIDSHTLELSNKLGGKVTFTGRVVVSADGKTRTVTISGLDGKGVKQTSTAVYDRQ